MKIYVVSNAFTSSSVFLLATTKSFVFFFIFWVRRIGIQIKI